MRNRRRHEVASAGLDDFLATLGGHGTGLRVPAAVAGTGEGAPLFPPYLFLLAVADLVPGDALAGVAQIATVAAPQSSSAQDGAPFYPFEREITSPLWHPPDGFIEWILTADRTPPSSTKTGPLDQDTFIFEDCETPCLLYETAHFPAVPTAPGYLGLDGYTPPGIRGESILTVRDLRYPWTDRNTLRSLLYPAHTNTRLRLYARVQQTSAITRIGIPINGQSPIFFQYPGAFGPEDQLLAASQGGALAEDTFQYWRVGGRLILDRANRHLERGEAAGATRDNP